MQSGSQFFCSASIQLNGNRKSKFNRPTARWRNGSISILIRSLFTVSVYVSTWFDVRLFVRSEFNWNNYFRWNRKSRKVFKRNLILFCLSISNEEFELMIMWIFYNELFHINRKPKRWNTNSCAYVWRLKKENSTLLFNCSILIFINC